MRRNSPAVQCPVVCAELSRAAWFRSIRMIVGMAAVVFLLVAATNASFAQKALWFHYVPGGPHLNTNIRTSPGLIYPLAMKPYATGDTDDSVWIANGAQYGFNHYCVDCFGAGAGATYQGIFDAASAYIGVNGSGSMEVAPIVNLATYGGSAYAQQAALIAQTALTYALDEANDPVPDIGSYPLLFTYATNLWNSGTPEMTASTWSQAIYDLANPTSGLPYTGYWVYDTDAQFSHYSSYGPPSGPSPQATVEQYINGSTTYGFNASYIFGNADYPEITYNAFGGVEGSMNTYGKGFWGGVQPGVYRNTNGYEYHDWLGTQEYRAIWASNLAALAPAVTNVSVSTWNDMGEYSNICPSTTWGYTLTDLTQAYTSSLNSTSTFPFPASGGGRLYVTSPQQVFNDGTGSTPTFTVEGMVINPTSQERYVDVLIKWADGTVFAPATAESPVYGYSAGTHTGIGAADMTFTSPTTSTAAMHGYYLVASARMYNSSGGLMEALQGAPFFVTPTPSPELSPTPTQYNSTVEECDWKSQTGNTINVVTDPSDSTKYEVQNGSAGSTPIQFIDIIKIDQYGETIVDHDANTTSPSHSASLPYDFPKPTSGSGWYIARVIGPQATGTYDNVGYSAAFAP